MFLKLISPLPQISKSILYLQFSWWRFHSLEGVIGSLVVGVLPYGLFPQEWSNSNMQLRKEWCRYSHSLHRKYLIDILHSLPHRRRKFNILRRTQQKFGFKKRNRNEQKPDNFLHFRYKVILQKERGDGKRNCSRKCLGGDTHRLFYYSNFKYDTEA